ncbi:MAG: BlaI/MecI/CopY family transcriptional regulator [Bryobacteraceae bacterium]
MKQKKALPKPTAAELDILRVLWQRGPSTVRAVYEALGNPEAAYTTTLKFMQIMAAKGLVERDDSQRAHLYRPAVGQEETQRRLVDELMDKAFGGSAADLVLRALSRKSASKEELAEIRRMIATYEGEAK